MFNFSWSEMLIVGALALIVIGPKDLPRMMRSIGKFVGQARGLARQFQRSMDDAAREADLSEFKEAKDLISKARGATDMSSVTKSLKEQIGVDDTVDPSWKMPSEDAPKSAPTETAKATPPDAPSAPPADTPSDAEAAPKASDAKTA